MRKYLNIILVSLFLCLGLAIPIASASDYFVYSELDTGKTGSYGPDGYIGSDGINRIIFYSSTNAYIYKVSIPAGEDPNMHPDNPDATGPIAPRTYTFEKSFDLGVSPGHESEFYVDAENNIIYLGASEGIRKYIYDTNTNNYIFDSQIAPPSPNEGGYSTQSLAYEPDTNIWYAGSIAMNTNPGITLRDVWKYNGSQGNGSTWVMAFQYTTPETTASHHDGMEFINGYLYLADYQGDYVKQYTTDGTLIKKFTYQPLGHELEGMGFGALKHFWVGSHSNKITEFGGGALQVALDGIPDQCAPSGQGFTTIDLDSYTTGTQPFSWTYSGNTNLIVTIDSSNIATITYPSAWIGSETITFTVTDSNGISASDDATFTVEQVPVIGDIPDQITPFTPINLDSYLAGPAASTVTWTASGNVNLVVVIDSVTHIATVTNPSNSNTPETITFTATASCCGNPISDSDSATFSFDNEGPITSNVVINLNPTPVGTATTLTALVSDLTTGGSKIASAEFNIDDGSFIPMNAQDLLFDEVTEDVITNIASFSEAGVHNICVRGTDAAGNVGALECSLLAVYDPSAGFVTGGGNIISPAGAYYADPSLTGRANFGFVSKYLKGATVPTGQTEFQFKVASLNFHSTAYEWLVVAGAKAQYKGTGTINGAGSYNFMLTAIDGQKNGGVDKFRIKIWDDAGKVYDNQLDAPDNEDPTTAIDGGSIVIHTK